MPYFDDVLVASTNTEEHNIYSRSLAAWSETPPLKCVLDKPFVGFIGCLITAAGAKPLPQNVQVIAEFPKIETVAELKCFLAMLISIAVSS